MGLMCSQSVLDLGKANADEAFRRYYEWWDPDVPSEDKAFDTGATFSSVCKAVKRFGDEPQAAATAQFQKTGSAGINAAHRTQAL